MKRMDQGETTSPDQADSVDVKKTLERRAEELSILNHLAEAISSSLDLDDILHSICREMVMVLNARNVGIALLNDKKDSLKVVAFHTEQIGETDVTGLEFSLEGNDASLFVIKTGEPIVVPDAQSNPITRSMHEVFRQRGTSCLMVVPLLARGEVIGTIGIPSNAHEVFSQDDVRLSQTIAGQVASVIDNARLHQSVKKARDVAERELEIGRQIQTSFFPESIPELNGWQVAVYFQSARQVAGDFYDVFALEEGRRMGVILADVCDKGVGAALFMVLFRSLLRASLIKGFAQNKKTNRDPGEILVSAIDETNKYIAINHARASMFATLFAAVIEQDKDELCYLNCGHDAPVVLRKSGEVERLKPGSPAIGMFADLEFNFSHLSLDRDDSIIAFTDGVTDARSPDDKPFGEKRLMTVLSDSKSLQSRFEFLKKEITEHISEADQFDDITFIGLERKG
ncbi:MAG: SpoIIE family protein phosphatase [Desulfofustis sp.]|nr:SpoIIE family protein phosphatase [Desulfofustis sp.]